MLDALSSWPVAAALRGSAIAYPLVNAAHIASVGLLLGAIVTLDLRLLGAFRSHPLAHLVPPLVRVAAAGFIGAAATGVLLFSTRPAAYLENPAFLAKLALIGLGALNAVTLRLNPRWGDVAKSERIAACASLLVWLGAIVAGRWIGFMH